MGEIANFFVSVGSKFDPSGTNKADSAFKGIIFTFGDVMNIAKKVSNFFSTELVAAAASQEQANINLAAAMKQAGTYTEEAYQHNLKYASSLQQLTVYGDEMIMNVQKMLTNFGVEGIMLDKLTAATLDLASAKKMDLSAAADLVAKSVGSSTNSLSRYGITVEGAVGSSKRMEMAIDNITKLFGGAAAADAETYNGKVLQLKNTLGDLYEDVGFLLLPVYTELVNFLKDNAIPAFQQLFSEKSKTAAMTKFLAGQVGALIQMFVGVADVIKYVYKAIEMLGTAYLALVTRQKLFFALAKKQWEGLQETIVKDGEFFKKIQDIKVESAQDAQDKIIAGLKKSTKKQEQIIKKSAVDLMKLAEDSADYTRELNDALRKEEAEKQDAADALTMERRMTLWTQGTGLLESYYGLKLLNIQNDTAQSLENEDAQYAAKRDYILKNVTDEEQQKLQLDLLEQQHAANTDKIKNDGLEKEKDMKRKLKTLSIAEAIVNTAVGFTKALAQGGIYGIVMGSLVTAAGAIQIATIRAQKFAKGAMAMQPTLGLFGEAGAEVALPLNHPNTTSALAEAFAKAGAGAGGGNIFVTVPPITTRQEARKMGDIIGKEIYNQVRRNRKL